METSWGPIYLSEEWWALDHLHGRLPLRDALALNGTAMSRLAPGLCASDLLGAAFVDVETTGLTGGTGTYVFLVGIGTFEDGSFHLRQFFLALPPDDRRYFRVDVAKREVVEHRIRQAESGEAHRLMALVGDEVVAVGGLEFAGEGWHRHLAEIRVIVARDYRRRKLGAMLVAELFRDAQTMGLEKVVVKMAAPQTAARKICDRLGFHVDAVLPDHVKDSEGNLHAQVVMSCTLDEM